MITVSPLFVLFPPAIFLAIGALLVAIDNWRNKK